MNKIPRFPVELRKMWTGHEVQQWIDDNINKPKDGQLYELGVPEGYKIVPMEPTKKMLTVLMDSISRNQGLQPNDYVGFCGTREDMSKNYKAMLDVAPTIEAGFYYYDEGVNSENQ